MYALGKYMYVRPKWTNGEWLEEQGDIDMFIVSSECHLVADEGL